MPIIRIAGEAPGLPLTFDACGDMADNFSESYSVEISAKDRASGDQPGQSPHPPDMNFDKGSFENTRFTVFLFSGCLVNGAAKHSGRDLMAVAETLYKISMPRPDGNSFIGPPLVIVTYGAFWQAQGLFQRVAFTSKGAWDAQGYPTLITLEMEFARHFGGGSAAGGIYRKATKEELKKATAAAFAFRG